MDNGTNTPLPQADNNTIIKTNTQAPAADSSEAAQSARFGIDQEAHKGFLRSGLFIGIIVFLFLSAAGSAYYFFVYAPAKSTENEVIDETPNTNKTAIVEKDDVSDEADEPEFKISDYVKIESPFVGSSITSPVAVKGRASEAFFPSGAFQVRLEDRDGNQLGDAEARVEFPEKPDSNGMLEFSAKLIFDVSEEMEAILVLAAPSDAEVQAGDYTMLVKLQPEAGGHFDPEDADEDGLYDFEESRLLTKVNNPDTDGDGFTDGDEVAAGYNPNGPGMLAASLSTPEAAILSFEIAQSRCDFDYFNKNIGFSERVDKLGVDVENLIGDINEDELRDKILNDVFAERPYVNEVERIEVLEKEYFSEDRLYIKYLVHYKPEAGSIPNSKLGENALGLIDGKWQLDVYSMMDYEVRQMNKIEMQKQKSRDAKRVADIKQIQTTLEIFYTEEGSYPEMLVPGQLMADDASYNTVVPTNPVPAGTGCEQNSEYSYAPGEEGQTYELTYCLEEDTGNIPAGVNVASPQGVSDKSISEEQGTPVEYQQCKVADSSVDEPEERNAKRWNDVNTILSAIKLQQIDNDGRYPEVIDNLEDGVYYQIGDSDDCSDTCVKPEVELAVECVDISYLIEDGYMAVTLVDPLANTEGEIRSGYYLQKFPGNTIEVGACHEEPGTGGVVKEISVRR